MKEDFFHAEECLSNAVRALATGRGSVLIRLADSYVSWHHLLPDELPKEIAPDYESLRNVFHESLRAGVLSVPEEQAVALADRLVSMLFEVQRLRGTPRP